MASQSLRLVRTSSRTKHSKYNRCIYQNIDAAVSHWSYHFVNHVCGFVSVDQTNRHSNHQTRHWDHVTKRALNNIHGSFLHLLVHMGRSWTLKSSQGLLETLRVTTCGPDGAPRQFPASIKPVLVTISKPHTPVNPRLREKPDRCLPCDPRPTVD